MGADQVARELFAARFGVPAAGLIRSPGRVNLIGDHTDYNDGFVLPMAIDRGTYLAYTLRDDTLVRLAAEGHDPVEFDLSAVERGGPAWGEYVKGVAWATGATTGFDGAVAGDLPVGAGLSSSASLELAAARAFGEAAGGRWSPVEAASAAQRAENDWVGMACGIMDQLVIATGVTGHAVLIDCRSLETRPVPIPSEVVVVVLDTGTRRELVGSGYNERRMTCEQAAAALGVSSLRDLTIDDLDSAARTLDDVSFRRVRHVVTENVRVEHAAGALAGGDLVAVGALMADSHQSLRDDYEVSSDALDAMVAAAQAAPGCVGARMTGAGFGGAAVALIHREGIEDFTEEASKQYTRATGITPDILVTVPAAGVEVAR